VFRARIGTETDEIDVPGIPNENFIVLASHQDNFAISDLESFYFSEFGAEADRVRAYIYTDRPIYHHGCADLPRNALGETSHAGAPEADYLCAVVLYGILRG
jgi:hypothetical protein